MSDVEELPIPTRAYEKARVEPIGLVLEFLGPMHFRMLVGLGEDRLKPGAEIVVRASRGYPVRAGRARIQSSEVEGISAWVRLEDIIPAMTDRDEVLLVL